jgi:hypothetical protein
MEADFMSQEELQELLDARHEPAISIYLPMVRRGPEVRGNAVMLKNALAEVGDALKAEGWRTPDVEDLLAAPRRLLQDTPYWQHQREGLALFFAPGVLLDYRLPLAFEAQTVINNRFYVKPLLPFFSEDGHYYILAVSQGKVRLLQATRHTVEELPLGETVPASLAEALEYDDPEDHLNVHSVSAGAAGRESGRPEVSHHGHGGLDDATDYRLRRFLRKVSTGLQQRLAGERAPLVFAGVDYLHPIFADGHDSEELALLPEGLHGNPDQLNAAELQEQTWEIVAPVFRRQREEAINRYENVAQTEQASDDLEQLVLGAVQGRVDTLFVATDRQQWGRYDAGEHRVFQHDEQETGDDDLLDLAAVHTLANGGAVYAVAQEAVPGQALAAAIFRY